MSPPAQQLVRYKKGKHAFEIATKPGAALKYRDGKLGINNVYSVDLVFKNFSKAEKANAAELKEVFGTDNEADVMKTILDEGELQVSAAERKAKHDKKRAEILNYLHKYYVQPKTNKPHPLVRFENAFKELRINIDPDASTEDQVRKIAKQLPEVLPIKKSEMRGKLVVKHAHLGPVMGIVKKLAKVEREKYDSNGCVMEISCVPGDYELLMKQLSDASKGECVFEIEGAALPTADVAGANGGGGGKKGKKGKKKGRK